MADPDTIRVSRDINGNLALKEIAVGKKGVKIIMEKGEIASELKSQIKILSVRNTEVL